MIGFSFSVPLRHSTLGQRKIWLQGVPKISYTWICYRTKVRVPNAQWGQTNRNVGSLEQRKVYCRAMQEERVARAPQNSGRPEGLQQSIFKGQGRPRVCDQLGHNSLMGSWWSILRSQIVWGLHAHDHQVVHFFHLVVVLASEKLRKHASDTIIQVLQRGAKAEDMGEGFVPGRPCRVLLGYNCRHAEFAARIIWSVPIHYLQHFAL